MDIHLHGLTSEQRAHYERCREKGTTHNIALILASGKPPKTERRDDRWRNGIMQHGLVDPDVGPGDPGAVVHSKAEARKRIDDLRRKGVIDQVLDGPANAGAPAQQRSSRRPIAHG